MKQLGYKYFSTIPAAAIYFAASGLKQLFEIICTAKWISATFKHLSGGEGGGVIFVKNRAHKVIKFNRFDAKC